MSAMATVFRYGPYVWFSEDGVLPGTEHFWTFGPWPWYSDAVIITAHPFALAGANRSMAVQASRQGLHLMGSGSSIVLFATSVLTG